MFINTVLEWPDEKRPKFERVLAMNKVWTVVIDVLAKKGFPVFKKTADLETAVKDGLAIEKELVFPFMKVSEDEIPPEAKSRRDRAMMVVECLTKDDDIFYSRKRGGMVIAAMKEFGITKPTVHKYLRQYWQGGGHPNALLPNHRGMDKNKRVVKNKLGCPHSRTLENPDHKGIIITDEIKRTFEKGCALFYKGRGKKAKKAAYDEMIRKFFSPTIEMVDGRLSPVPLPEHQRPTFNQFNYWFEKYKKPTEHKVRIMGEREYNLKERPVLGSTLEGLDGPGAWYQIDATITKEYLRSSWDRNKVIGQGVVYIVSDVYTRLITGLYIGLEGPSWIGAMQAIYNAYQDKVEFCREFDIDITPGEWPAKGLPGRIMGDRGEFAGENGPNNLVDRLFVQVENAASYRADMKSVVESHFKKLEGQRLPWSCPEIFKANLDDSLLEGATLTLPEMYKIMIRSILEHNLRYMRYYCHDKDAIAAGVEPIPCKLWEWGIRAKRGKLKVYDDDFVKASLLPQGSGRITRHGIQFKRGFYLCDEALNEGWYDGKRGRKCMISYDPRNLDIVQLWEPDRKKYIPCYLSDKEQALRGLGHEERRLYCFYKSVQERTIGEKVNTSSAVRMQATTEAIWMEAKRKNEAARGLRSAGKSASRKSVRENREVERILVREKEAWLARAEGQGPKNSRETIPIKEFSPKERQRQAMLESAII